MRRQQQSNGQIHTMGPLLARGGEACIYVVPGTSWLAKVYHEPTDARRRKLAAMLANPPQDPMATQGHRSIAWPVDLLCTTDGSGSVDGFLMPRVPGVSPIIEFYHPQLRRQHCPLFHYQYLLHTACNLASAVEALHARDYVIGDVNETNILVSQTSLVTLVDTDSFQVREPQNGPVYRCTVHSPRYTPPELQGKDVSQMDRSPEHDHFGLAVVIFQLLMEGTHPFSGVYTGPGDAPSLETRIARGHFPHAVKTAVPFRPKPGAPPFEVLSPTLQQLFVRCFEDGHTNPRARPDARTWQAALQDAERALTTCSVNSQHRHGNHLKDCPWCVRTRQCGHDPFPSVRTVQRGQHLSPVTPRWWHLWWHRGLRTVQRGQHLSPVTLAQTPLAAPGTPARAATAAFAMRHPLGTAPLHPASRPRPTNGWAWGAAAFALLSLTGGHSLAGAMAVLCGMLGWRRARVCAGRGAWMSRSAVAVGLLAVVLSLPHPSFPPNAGARTATDQGFSGPPAPGNERNPRPVRVHAQAVRWASESDALLDNVEQSIERLKRHPPTARRVRDVREHLRSEALKAADKADRAVRDDPAYAHGYVCKVQALRFAQQYGEAYSLAQAAIARFPTDRDLPAELAVLRIKLARN